MEMTMVQEAARIMESMPRKKQQIVLDLLRVMNQDEIVSCDKQKTNLYFKRSGKTQFHLPSDFDEHFDDLNEEIAAMFAGETV